MRFKGQHGLLTQFALLLTLFSIIAMVVSAVATHLTQRKIHMIQEEEKLQSIAEYLSFLIKDEGMDFAAYQRYFMAHHDEMEIPFDFDYPEIASAREAFEASLAEEYPGKLLGRDVFLEDLSPEAQMAYAVYAHEYFLYLFEKARETFGLAYAYYMVPTGQDRYMCYVLDGVREEREGAPDSLKLGDEVLQSVEAHPKMWEAWETGEPPFGYDTYDNEYGKTYAWYTPLFIDGEKLGLIGTEVEIKYNERIIAENTRHQLGVTAAVLILLEMFAMWGFNHFYVLRIRHLIDGVDRYARDKDARIAGEIESRTARNDEIGILGTRTAEMILEMENYMNSLIRTADELIVSRTQVDVMSKAAHKDVLTGVRNGNAYRDALRRLDARLRAGESEFGIVVVDLNNLKKINDTYGHETGNFAIKKCCKCVCDVFCHSPVFRIGGDEFVVVLENNDFRNVKYLINKFNRVQQALKADKTLKEWERFSAAIGYALYDPSMDDSVESVFRRADQAMYEKKKQMHEGRT